MHHRKCDRCEAIQACWGIDIRGRLEELRPQGSERKLVSGVLTMANETDCTCSRTVCGNRQNQQKTIKARHGLDREFERVTEAFSFSDLRFDRQNAK